MRCLMGIKDTPLSSGAGHHKKSHYFWECDQSHSQIDPSDRCCWHETPNTRWVSPLSADRRRDRCGAHTQRSFFYVYP